MVPTSLKAIMAAALISGRDGWGAFAQFFADTVRNISQFARNNSVRGFSVRINLFRKWMHLMAPQCPQLCGACFATR